MTYYNLQPRLTTKVLEFDSLPGSLNIYKAIELVAPDEIYLHMYQYKDSTDPILAMALSTGCHVTLDIESINEVIHLAPYTTIKPSMFRFYNKDRVYNYIRETLRSYKAEMYRVDEEVKYLRDKNNTSKYFKVTEEIEKFITTYAQAYGLSVPRFRDKEVTSDSHLPKHWSEGYNAILGLGKHIGGGNSNPERAFAKWDNSEKRSRLATPLYEIEQLFDSLMFYKRNNVPFNDNYTHCPQCNKPMRTNRYGITELQDHKLCIDCDEDHNRADEIYSSFDESYMRTKDNCGRKITAQKNVLDA